MIASCPSVRPGPFTDMTQTTSTLRKPTPRFAKISTSGLVISFFVGFIASRLDDYTVLKSPSMWIEEVPIPLSIALGLCFMPVGWAIAKDASNRALTGIIISILATFAAFFPIYSASQIVLNIVDFPSRQTVTHHSSFIKLKGAIASHGKGTHWSVQTMPMLADLQISEQDFKFMQSQQPRDRAVRSPDVVSSDGRFCVKVDLQTTPDAIRVVGAGSHKLPPGTVVVCPPST